MSRVFPKVPAVRIVWVTILFTRKYSKYITVPHTILDEDFTKSEKNISKDMLKTTVVLFTPACNTA